MLRILYLILNRHRLCGLWQRLLKAALILWALFTLNLPSNAEMPSSIGTVTLVLGKALIYNSDGSQLQVKVGDSLAEGDQIKTALNGHVHIRFVDNALVSVRPNSQLEIERYEYDPDRASESTVKFHLKEGVTRSISGDAARSARHRFRLNTPIAAIGVRGTDFVVSSDSEATRALVNEGAIVMAPFSDSCMVDALGPCNSNALELSGGSLRMAAVEIDVLAPTALSLQNARAPDFMQSELQKALTDGTSPSASALKDGADSEQDISNEVLLEAVTTVEVRTDAAIAAAKVEQTDFLPTDPIVVSSEKTVVQFDHTPPSPLTESSLKDRQLVWGRYADSPSEVERLGIDYKQASSSRDITVGTLDYGLFRSDNGPRRMVAELGLVGFQLSSAQAFFNSETGIAVMTVEDGVLDIDFQSSSFKTSLELSSALTGPVAFSAVGGLFDGGFLRSIDAAQRMAGAISFDGSEAGYFFEKQHGSGSISGLTLWDSK